MRFFLWSVIIAKGTLTISNFHNYQELTVAEIIHNFNNYINQPHNSWVNKKCCPQSAFFLLFCFKWKQACIYIYIVCIYLIYVHLFLVWIDMGKSGPFTRLGKESILQSEFQNILHIIVQNRQKINHTFWPTWPASCETCMQVRKQQLKLDIEQQTGSK